MQQRQIEVRTGCLGFTNLGRSFSAMDMEKRGSRTTNIGGASVYVMFRKVLSRKFC